MSMERMRQRHLRESCCFCKVYFDGGVPEGHLCPRLIESRAKVDVAIRRRRLDSMRSAEPCRDYGDENDGQRSA